MTTQQDITFWAYVQKELSELQPIFEKVFQGLTLYRDYEDTWEWLKGRTTNEQYELNISRQHNWKQGLYDKELIILIKSKFQLNIDEIGHTLKTNLTTTIYYGIRTYLKGNDFKFEIERKY